MNTAARDAYVAVSSTGAAATASALPGVDVSQLWNGARTTNKAGETRTFYAADKVIVAISTGADKTPKAGELGENELKELSRRNVSHRIEPLASSPTEDSRADGDVGIGCSRNARS
jgi:predicted PilT family ATPase